MIIVQGNAFTDENPEVKKAKEMNDNNRGFAIAGIIISSIFIGFGLIITLLFFFIFKSQR